MNRAFLSCLKSYFFTTAVALVATSPLAFAADAASASVAATPSATAKAPSADRAKGEALYTSGDNGRGIVACLSCHGAGGNSTSPANPKLAGQHEGYIVKQMADFKTPDRNQAIMTAFSKTLKDEDVRNIAAYLTTQKPKPGAAKNKDIVTLGKKIYRGGIAEKSIPACAGCHGPNGAGIPAQYPRLAGQHQDYTAAQLNGFRTKARKNSVQMVDISKNLSKEEIDAVSDYIAGLK
jgi:cytochrome c553